MTKGAKIGIGCLVALIIVVIIAVSAFKGMYNSLVNLDESVTSAWAQVENQLQRRYDLIPNLVETVKGYAAHEEGVLTEVTKARASVGGATTPTEKMSANNELSGALSRLLVVVEQYPNLKANENFIRLQDELAGTENRISVERKRYNDEVQMFNKKIRSFPTLIFAGWFGFEKRIYFEAPAEAKNAPKVSFSKE
jgi:LemA protein